jgi:hypothetical protein
VGEVTLEAMKVHAATSPARGLRFMAMCWESGEPPTYAEFVDAVQQATAFACNDMARNPKLHASKSEDELTDVIAGILRAYGFEASFDSMVGGHCDLKVSRHEDFLWLAEAKKHTGHSWLWQGYQQLSTRYQPGDPNSSHGGMLIYCFKPDTVKQMASWKAYMASKNPALVFPAGGSGRLAGMFLSEHFSPRSGLPQLVLHYPVALYFSPADKKATSAKKVAVKSPVLKKVAVAKKKSAKSAPAKKSGVSKKTAPAATRHKK